MKITMRLATIDDFDVICDLLEQVDRWHRERYPRFFRPANPARPRDMLSEWMANTEQAIALAVQGEKVVGLIQIAIREVPDLHILQPRRYMLIDTIVVHEDHRKQGIGKILMTYAHDWARKQTVYEFQLGVYISNESAVRFYESLGYTATSQRMVYYDDVEG